jgi:hypothetical protein
MPKAPTIDEKRQVSAKIRISQEERDLAFAIMGGVPQIALLIGQMRIISQDAESVPYMDILRYMKSQNLVGWNLYEWWKDKHENSVLGAIADLRQRANKEYKLRKIFAKPTHISLK